MPIKSPQILFDQMLTGRELTAGDGSAQHLHNLASYWRGNSRDAPHL
jgi:hypothetical protein